MVPLPALEAVIDASGAAPRIEALLPSGARPRQLSARTLLLTCRQAEYTFRLVTRALGKDEPDGLPSALLQRTCDDLLEASIPAELKNASRSLAVDWSDLQSFSRPPPSKGGSCADPEASWGHRRTTCATTRTSCSSATTCRTPSWCRTSRARPCPRPPAA
jgi:hypothetical protein